MSDRYPQYDFSHGLRFRERVYNGREEQWQDDEIASEELRFEPSCFELADRALDDIRVERGLGDAAVEFVCLGDPESPETEFYHLEWNTNVRDPGVRPLLGVLAQTSRRRLVFSTA